MHLENEFPMLASLSRDKQCFTVDEKLLVDTCVGVL